MTNPRPRYADYSLPDFNDVESLGIAVRQLVKQLNEMARDTMQILNSTVSADMISMEINTDSLPITIPTTLDTPRGCIAVMCLNLDDPTDVPANPAVHWTYADSPSTVLVNTLDGLTASTKYMVSFLILDAKSRGDAQPLPQPQVI